MIHSSDKEEAAVDTWSECRDPPPWGSDPTRDAGIGNEVTWVPRGGTAAHPSALFMSHLHNSTDAAQKYQLRANSCRYLDPELSNERDIRCRHLAEKILWLKKPNPFWTAAFCPSATAGEFVRAQRESSVGSLIGFPIFQPREIQNWDEGVGRQDEVLYCTLKYLWDTFDKYNLTKI